MRIEKIKEKLTGRGYYVSPFGLILEKDKADYAIAEIRYSERRVIVSQGEGAETTKLKRILKEEKIKFRKISIAKLF